MELYYNLCFKNFAFQWGGGLGVLECEITELTISAISRFFFVSYWSRGVSINVCQFLEILQGSYLMSYTLYDNYCTNMNTIMKTRKTFIINVLLQWTHLWSKHEYREFIQHAYMICRESYITLSDYQEFCMASKLGMIEITWY